MVALMYVAHQDLIHWHMAKPMVFGFLPIGLAYHALYSIATAGMMAILVKFAWPKELDKQENAPLENQTPRP